MITRGVWVLSVVALTISCIRTNSVTIGRKTDLERQLMGRLEPLSEEELLAASVRAPAPTGSSPLRELEDRAIAARRRQLFNQDDLETLSRAGCIGEARDGFVVSRPCEGSDLLSLRDRLLREENADRNAVVDWAIEAEPGLTPGDRQQVLQIYHTLRVEQAGPGTPVQRDDGSWTAKE